MSDIFDYLDWRGDISFKESPFNEADNIIFNLLTYINYTDVVPEVFTQSLTIQEAAKSDFTLHKIPDPRLYALLEKCAGTRRFMDVRLTGYVDVFNEEEDCQFCAVTYLYDRGCAYVVYRGTDSSVTGLIEDFNMVYKAPIPSQAKGVHYLEQLTMKLPWWNRSRQLMIGGHSKGGNVAQYAAIHCSKRTQKHISIIWSNDGPGFNEELFPKEWSVPLVPKMKTFLPSASFIGRLFNHEEETILISSSDAGLMSHDPFTWKILGTQLVRVDSDSPKTERLDRSFRDWLAHISLEERKNLIDAIFDVFKNMGVSSLYDFNNFKLTQAVSGIKTLTQLDAEQKKALIHSLTQFYKSYNL